MAGDGVTGALVSVYEKSGLECLNEDTTYPLTNGLYQPNVDLELRSLDDEQLLVKIPFATPVKISHLSIKCSKEVIDEGSGPKTVKLYTNDPNLDFNTVDCLVPKQLLTFTNAQLESGEKVPLRFVNFQRVQYITVFVESNQKDVDITRIGHLQLWGCPESTLDMSKWKPSNDEAGNES